MHVKCQSGKKCIFRRCFKIYLRYAHCVTIIKEIPRRVQVQKVTDVYHKEADTITLSTVRLTAIQ